MRDRPDIIDPAWDWFWGPNAAGIYIQRDHASFRDLSGNLRDGTLAGTADPSVIVGEGGSGFEFTSDERILLPTGIGAAMENDGVAIIVWDHDGTTTTGRFFNNRLGAADGYNFMISSNGTKLTCVIDTGAVVTLNHEISALPSGLHSTSIRYDGSTGKMYLDGIEVDSETQSGAVTQSNEFRLGNRADALSPLGAGRSMIGAYFFSPACTPEQCKQITRDPEGPFREFDEAGVVYALPAVGGGIEVFRRRIERAA